MARVVAASPERRAWDNKGCIQPSERHRMYSREENTKIPRKTIQVLPLPSCLLDALGRKS